MMVLHQAPPPHHGSLDTLREQSDSLEYSVKISFLELYNEEIFDLLSGIEDTSKLRLYEDAYKKGSVIIQVGFQFVSSVD